MLGAQRRHAIVAAVRRQGGVRVAELASTLGVSDMTVRRDIEALVEQGLLARVHGGAVAVDTDEPAFAAKAVRQAGPKQAIARAAAKLVPPGAAVGLSAGTTTAAVARELPAGVTIVTNSVPVSDLLSKTHTVILTGGQRTPSDALVGPIATAAIAGLNIDLLFLGVHGMSERGFTTPNLAEAETNRALVTAAQRVVVVADHSKWGVVGIATIAPLSAADVVVTDSGIDAEARSTLQSHVGHVLEVE